MDALIRETEKAAVNNILEWKNEGKKKQWTRNE